MHLSCHDLFVSLRSLHRSFMILNITSIERTATDIWWFKWRFCGGFFILLSFSWKEIYASLSQWVQLWIRMVDHIRFSLQLDELKQKPVSVRYPNWIKNRSQFQSVAPVELKQKLVSIRCPGWIRWRLFGKMFFVIKIFQPLKQETIGVISQYSLFWFEAFVIFVANKI